MSALKQRFKGFFPNWFIVVRNYRRAHGAVPNLIAPRTFNEKVVHRILFDRRPLLTQMQDKVAVRSYVESRLGSSILPKLYHLTNRPETIPFEKLPEKFVVKPTHGSGWVQIVFNTPALDRNAIIEISSGWLKRSWYKEVREWPYKDIEPRVMVQEFVDDGSGTTPNDYKVFVFGGQAEMIQVDTTRFTDHRRRLFTPLWQKLDVLLQYDDICGDVPQPPHLGEMIVAAETLGKDLDFIRVDFYDTAAGLYFGEITTIPEGGLGRFDPEAFDRYLGGRWVLPRRV